jgi:hypothetical protein
VKFAYLVGEELSGAEIVWRDEALKPDDLVVAAIEAGFSHSDIQSSPLGVLAQDFLAGSFLFRRGARVLIEPYGCSLVEVL